MSSLPPDRNATCRPFGESDGENSSRGLLVRFSSSPLPSARTEYISKLPSPVGGEYDWWSARPTRQGEDEEGQKGDEAE